LPGPGSSSTHSPPGAGRWVFCFGVPGCENKTYLGPSQTKHAKLHIGKWKAFGVTALVTASMRSSSQSTHLRGTWVGGTKTQHVEATNSPKKLGHEIFKASEMSLESTTQFVVLWQVKLRSCTTIDLLLQDGASTGHMFVELVLDALPDKLAQQRYTKQIVGNKSVADMLRRAARFSSAVLGVCDCVLTLAFALALAFAFASGTDVPLPPPPFRVAATSIKFARLGLTPAEPSVIATCDGVGQSAGLLPARPIMLKTFPSVLSTLMVVVPVTVELSRSDMEPPTVHQYRVLSGSDGQSGSG